MCLKNSVIKKQLLIYHESPNKHILPIPIILMNTNLHLGSHNSAIGTLTVAK